MGHLKDIGEGYFIHMTMALRFALYLTIIAVVCTIHAFLPFLFTDTASKMVSYLNDNMKNRGQ